MIKRKIVSAILIFLLLIAAINFRGIAPVWARDILVDVLLEPSLEADLVYEFRDGAAAVRVFDSEGGFSLGYVNRYGQFIIPARDYPLIPNWQTPQFSHGLVAVYSPEDGATGFFDASGGMVVPFMYDRAPGVPFEFAGGLAAVSLDGMWGFIDTGGEVQVPFRFESAGSFSEGLASVLYDGNWGFINTDGDTAIPFVLEHLNQEGVVFVNPGFSEGLAPVILNLEVGPRWGFMNRDGNRIHSYMYIFVEGLHEGRALVMRETEEGVVFGFINRSGEEVIPTEFSFARSFSHGLAAVQQGGLWGFVDHYNSVQVPIRFDEARSFAGNLAAVRIDNRWGFIDRWGTEAVPITYYEVRDFSDGLAAVRLGEGSDARWGYVDQRGNIIVPAQYLDAHSFSEGLAWVRGPEGWGILQITAANGQDEAETPAAETRYIYQATPDYLRFIPPSGALAEIYDSVTADEAIFSIARSLTQEQRSCGDALNIAALFIENAMSRGTTQVLPPDGTLRISTLQGAYYIAQAIGYRSHITISNENLRLLRQLGTNINFTTQSDNSISLNFPDDVSGAGFDNLTVEADFASLSLNRRHIPRGSEIIVERGSAIRGVDNPQPGSGTTESPGGLGGFFSTFWAGLRDAFDGFTPRGFLSSPADYLLEFWAVPAFLVIIIVWGVLFSFGHKFRLWVVPVVTILCIIGNFWTLGLIQQGHRGGNLPAGYFHSVNITMSPGMRATVSIPLGGSAPDGLILFNDRGIPQLSWFNPVTNTIDARIHGGGTFSLRQHTTGFADISGTDPMVQYAALSLTSMGIMHGTGEQFRPGSAITRAELALAIVTAFDLLDTTAPNRFEDNSPGDRYYQAINTATNLGLIQGYDDATFRGSWAITKSDLVYAVAEAMVLGMGYLPPYNTPEVLARYIDRDGIAYRAQPGVAIATAANVLIFREDGLFAPDSVMSRGDAAVVIYRMLERLW